MQILLNRAQMVMLWRQWFRCESLQLLSLLNVVADLIFFCLFLVIVLRLFLVCLVHINVSPVRFILIVACWLSLVLDKLILALLVGVVCRRQMRTAVNFVRVEEEIVVLALRLNVSRLVRKAFVVI